MSPAAHPDRMRAVQIRRHGGIDVLEVNTVPVPTLAPGEVLVRTVASSINPVDWKTRAWDRGPAMPMLLGWDLAGIVVATAGSHHAPGDRVVAMSGQVSTGLGTWAELVAVPERLLAPAPATASLAEAGTLPLAGLTAQQALRILPQEQGSRLLVIGAVGAVGAIVVQLATAAGLHVDAVVSRAAHVAAATELGAARVVTGLDDLGTTYGAIFDSVGLAPGAALADGGVYLSISDEPLPEVPGARGMGVQEDGDGLARLVELVDAGRLRLRIGARFPLREVRQAHAAFERGGLVGKVVLDF